MTSRLGALSLQARLIAGVVAVALVLAILRGGLGGEMPLPLQSVAFGWTLGLGLMIWWGGFLPVLIVWLRRLPRGEWRTALPLALVIGGALGNLVDRVRFDAGPNS